MYRAAVYDALRRVISFAAPNRCPFCTRLCGTAEIWHECCFETLPFLDGALQPPFGVSELYAVCRYENAARRAVLEYKKGFFIYAAEAFAVLIIERVGEELKSFDAIVPVPSAAEKTSLRGYSPAGLIARLVSMRSGVPVANVLVAVRGKAEQKALGAIERTENARLSFKIKSGAVSGKRVLLIDDVCTTGSTLSACAELLKKAGAAGVSAAVFAKTIKG